MQTLTVSELAVLVTYDILLDSESSDYTLTNEQMSMIKAAAQILTDAYAENASHLCISFTRLLYCQWFRDANADSRKSIKTIFNNFCGGLQEKIPAFQSWRVAAYYEPEELNSVLKNLLERYHHMQGDERQKKTYKPLCLDRNRSGQQSTTPAFRR